MGKLVGMYDSITQSPLPDTAFLKRFADQGEYTDCFVTDLAIEASLPDFVEAFYTTWLFNAERFVLKWFVSLPSTDDEARQVALGTRDTFAAWNVEDRSEEQLLLIDFRKRTGSWFMVETWESGSRLFFGSVVFRTEKTPAGRQMRWPYRVLLGLHRLYSRALLSAAHSRLLRGRRASP